VVMSIASHAINFVGNLLHVHLQLV